MGNNLIVKTIHRYNFQTSTTSSNQHSGSDPNELTSHNFKSYSEMRWGDDGDEGAGGGDDVDDDPDDARRDGDFPLREGISLADFSPAGALLLSVRFSPCKGTGIFLRGLPPTFLGQRQLIRRRGAGVGHRGQGRAPATSRGGPTARGCPYPWWLASVPPSGSVTYFPKIITPDFFFLEFSELRRSGVLTGTFPADSGL